MQFLAKLVKFTFRIGIFLLIGNVPGQLGIFQPIGKNVWYRKPDPVLYREKALTSHTSNSYLQCLAANLAAPLTLSATQVLLINFTRYGHKDILYTYFNPLI